MSKKLVIISAALVVLLGAAGGGVWWWKAQSGAAAAPAPAAEVHQPAKYLSIDKVVVMLRRMPGETAPHYLSADLVFVTSPEQEKEAKEALPLLRSVAVRALSALPHDQASTMSVDQMTVQLEAAYKDNFAKHGGGAPFRQVLIGKLILE